MNYCIKLNLIKTIFEITESNCKDFYFCFL